VSDDEGDFPTRYAGQQEAPGTGSEWTPGSQRYKETGSEGRAPGSQRYKETGSEGNVVMNAVVKDSDFLDDVDSAAIDQIENVAAIIVSNVTMIRNAMMSPSVLYKPTLTATRVGTWKVLYGEFVVYGATPAIAMRNFDIEWINRVNTR
jgi:hypothetical protein